MRLLPMLLLLVFGCAANRTSSAATPVCHGDRVAVVENGAAESADVVVYHASRRPASGIVVGSVSAGSHSEFSLLAGDRLVTVINPTGVVRERGTPVSAKNDDRVRVRLSCVDAVAESAAR